MLLAALLFIFGLSLSAFFSGSETGFYRIARVRLLIDALSGDWMAKGLMWAANNPSAFVATALVGNNVANFLVSRSVVMAADQWAPGHPSAELLMTVAVTPVVFIYGELMPKNLFFAAPNRLLRRCAPGLAVAGVLFAPVSAVLWAVGRLLQRIAGVPTQTLRMELARRELAEVLDEGHAVGLLSPAQRRLAQGTFASAGRRMREFMIPAARLARASDNLSRGELLRFARRNRQAIVIVHDPSNAARPTGCVRAVDCLIDPDAPDLPILPLLDAQAGASFLGTLLRLQAEGLPAAVVRDSAGRVVGYALADELRRALTATQ